MYYILLLFSVLLLFYLIRHLLWQHTARTLGKKLDAQLARMDKRYEEFIEERLSMEILRENNIDFNKEFLRHEAVDFLGPDLEALHFYMKRNFAGDVELGYESKYFSNLASLIENFYASNEQSSVRWRAPLSLGQIKQSAETAVKSDLAERTLHFKTRNYSE